MSLLSSGGSVAPVDNLRSIGIDVLKSEFYDNAFKVIEELVGVFENIPIGIG